MKTKTRRNSEGTVQRISISLPENVYHDLDELVIERGLENRSKAISEMISHFVLKHRATTGDPMMAGMIALVYDEAKGSLVQKLFELERMYLDEVISSMHVQLESNHRMEVIVVQGPVHILREITDKILACAGVLSCKLTLTDVIIPQIHSRLTKKK